MNKNKSKLNKKGGDAKSTLKALIKNFPKPENLSYIKIINPKEIPLDEIARLKCFQCG